MSDGRVQAPFGRRGAVVTAREVRGEYVVLAVRDPDGPLPDPGQFYMLSTAERWGGGEDERPFLPRAFSVLDAHGGERRFLLEDVGPGTRRLCRVAPGEELGLVGPLGNGFAPPAPGRRALLVGGGVGIAPLKIWQDRERPADGLPPLLGFRDGAHAVGAELFARPRVATDDGSVGHHGVVTELLADELEANPDREVLACGPPPMLEAVRVLCAERGVPAQLALESGMACGFGACFGCVVATRAGFVRLCLDGPVVAADALESALTPGAGH